MEIFKVGQYGFRSTWASSFTETLSELAECKLNLDQIMSIMKRRNDKGIFTLLAIEDNKVIGTVSYFIEPKFIHSGGFVGHLEDLATHSRCAGRGIGRKLVDRVILECEKEGCYKVILDCDEALEGYYNKLGFYRKGACMRYDLLEG